MKEFNPDHYGADNFRVTRRGRTLAVTLTYPPYEASDKPEKVRYVEFDQESVRASDGVRLHYDYDRDGVVIEQASRFAWRGDDDTCDPDWQEVAFIPSWGRQEPEEAEEARLADRTPTGETP